MKTKHTAGQWTVGNFPFLHVESNGKWVCQTSDIKNTAPFLSDEYAEESKRVKEEQEANAKLIASAPDLLQTLIELREYLNPDDYAHKDGIIEKIGNAIKKATE